MHASSLVRKLLTISFNVEMIASRFSPVKSEVSIMIPNDTACAGAAMILGRFTGGIGVVAALSGGSRSVSSNPMVAFVLPMGDEFFVLAADVEVPEGADPAGCESGAFGWLLLVVFAGLLVDRFAVDAVFTEDD